MLYDLNVLKNYSMGDATFELDIIQGFLDDAPDFLKTMKLFIGTKDYEKSKRLAHKYKSSIDVFGMKDLRVLLDEIEKKEEPEILKAFTQIETMIPLLIEKIKIEKAKYLK